MLTKPQIEIIFKRFAERNPDPKTELIYQSPFQLLIAVILSAQATDVSVNKVTKNLFLLAPTASAMLKLGLPKLKNLIRTIGLYNTKATNIFKTCEILCAQYQGEVPATREELEALPGVGRKTANVILNSAFGAETIAVDTHIFRVANRLGLASGKTVLAVELQLLERIPATARRHAHHWLVLHGRYICKARKPLCEQCFLTDICAWYQCLVKHVIPTNAV